MSTTINPLRQLAEFGQSLWLDIIRRGFIADGSLHRLVEADGLPMLKGVTSNPSIFEKAMGEYPTRSGQGSEILCPKSIGSAISCK